MKTLYPTPDVSSLVCLVLSASLSLVERSCREGGFLSYKRSGRMCSLVLDSRNSVGGYWNWSHQRKMSCIWDCFYSLI